MIVTLIALVWNQQTSYLDVTNGAWRYEIYAGKRGLITSLLSWQVYSYSIRANSATCRHARQLFWHTIKPRPDVLQVWQSVDSLNLYLHGPSSPPPPPFLCGGTANQAAGQYYVLINACVWRLWFNHNPHTCFFLIFLSLQTVIFFFHGPNATDLSPYIFLFFIL